MTRTQPTERQIGMLSFLIKTYGLEKYFQPRKEGGANYVFADAEKWMREHLTKNQASRLIVLIQSESYTLALDVLRRAGYPIV